MKTTLILIAATASLVWTGGTLLLDAQTNSVAGKSKEFSVPAVVEHGPNATDEAEAQFKALLTNATLSGRWCAVQDGQLGPDKEDSYNIVDIKKTSGDSWVVNARVKYGGTEFVAPISVKVKWAGDTPVLVVDKFGIPGIGTYSARVLFYEKTYSGTWSAGDHGGLLHGVVSKAKE